MLVSDGILDIYFSAEIYGFGYVYAGPFLNGLDIELNEALSINYNTPDNYDLNSPYPNPFNNNLKIPINLINDSQVKVDMLDVTGRIVDTIFDGNMKSGENILEWSSSNHASGMYIIRTTIDNKHNYEKTILLK